MSCPAWEDQRRLMVTKLFDGGVDAWFDAKKSRPHFTLALSRVQVTDPNVPERCRVVREYVTGPGFSTKLLLGGEKLPPRLQEMVQRALQSFIEETGRLRYKEGGSGRNPSYARKVK